MGATGGQCGSGLAGEHGGGEVPGRDGGGNANWLPDHKDAFVGLMPRNRIPVDALAFFREPLDEGGGIGNLVAGFGEGLALLQCHQPRQVFLVGHDQVEPVTQQACPRTGSQPTPGRQGPPGGGDGAIGLDSSHAGHVAQQGSICGIVYGNGGAGIGRHPRPVDAAEFAKQFWIAQLRCRRDEGTHCS